MHLGATSWRPEEYARSRRSPGICARKRARQHSYVTKPHDDDVLVHDANSDVGLAHETGRRLAWPLLSGISSLRSPTPARVLHALPENPPFGGSVHSLWRRATTTTAFRSRTTASTSPSARPERWTLRRRSTRTSPAAARARSRDRLVPGAAGFTRSPAPCSTLQETRPRRQARDRPALAVDLAGGRRVIPLTDTPRAPPPAPSPRTDPPCGCAPRGRIRAALRTTSRSCPCRPVPG